MSTPQAWTAVGIRAAERRGAQTRFCHGAGTKKAPSTFFVAVNHFAIVLGYDSLNRGENRMSDVEKLVRRKQLRNAALVALLVPAALLAGCAHPAPPPPPPPAPMAAPAPPPPPPAPAPVPVVRG